MSVKLINLYLSSVYILAIFVRTIQYLNDTLVKILKQPQKHENILKNDLLIFKWSDVLSTNIFIVFNDLVIENRTDYIYNHHGHKDRKDIDRAGELIASIRHRVTTSQSGTFYGNVATRAIDGVQNYAINACYCCSVASGSSSSWWQIDLGTNYLIGLIELYGRSDNTDQKQIEGSKVYAGRQSLSSNPQSGRLVYTVPNNIGSQFHFTKRIAPPIVARYFLVIVQNDLLTLCEFLLETSSCSNGYFGDGCSQSCHCSGSKGCDSVTGHCDKGECDPGWHGEACNIACGNRKFGSGCNSTCHCSDGSGCEPVHGSCHTSICEPGWRGTSCDKLCDHGHFGNGCNSTCNCINGTGCEPVTGFCFLSKCEPGLRGTSCDKSCDHRQFGSDCFYTCHCINGTGCEPASGTCNLSECELGWQGTSCSESCGKRTFGKNCANICHCANDSGCEPTHGTCYKQQCEDGWIGLSCSSACESHLFGYGCNNTCHCINGSHCDHISGVCDRDECEPGWTGASCNQECDYGKFGVNCSTTCHCRYGTNCDAETGHCPDGCDERWTGTSCHIGTNLIDLIKENVTTSMSSVYHETWIPSLAIDGNIGPDPSVCKCCARTTNAPMSWWNIDLGQMYPISAVVLFGRNAVPDIGQELEGFQIVLSNTSLYDQVANYTENVSRIVSTYTVPTYNTLARYIKIMRPGVLTLCEVSVREGECLLGTFGENCQRRCFCANGDRCSKDLGICPGKCQDGYHGPQCNRESTDEQHNDSTDYTSAPTNLPLIIGASVGGSTLVVLVASIIIIIIHRRRIKEKKKHNSTCIQHVQSNFNSFTKDSVYEGIEFVPQNNESIYETCSTYVNVTS